MEQNAEDRLVAVSFAYVLTRIERGQPIKVPKTELRRTVGSLSGDTHRI